MAMAPVPDTVSSIVIQDFLTVPRIGALSAWRRSGLAGSKMRKKGPWSVVRFSDETSAERRDRPGGPTVNSGTPETATFAVPEKRTSKPSARVTATAGLEPSAQSKGVSRGAVSKRVFARSWVVPSQLVQRSEERRVGKESR